VKSVQQDTSDTTTQPRSHTQNQHNADELLWRNTTIKIKVTLRLTVSQSVSLGVESHLGLMTRYLLLFDSYGLVWTGLSFVYAADPCQRGLFRVRVPWYSRPYLLSQIWDFPFRRLLRLSGSRWRYSTPPPHESLTIKSQSQNQSHIATDGQSVSNSWCRAPSGAHYQMFITVWQLQSCFYGAPSLTRGRVSLLYMLLALSSAVFLGSESLGTRDHQSRAEQSRAVAYCRQPATTVTLGIEPRWDPWPYICSMSLSSVLLCCHGNAFVNIRCRGNKCLLSRCLEGMTSSSAVIPAFRQCFPSRCLADGHIPSQCTRNAHSSEFMDGKMAKPKLY
jgi:hypothetical protein